MNRLTVTYGQTVTDRLRHRDGQTDSQRQMDKQEDTDRLSD